MTFKFVPLILTVSTILTGGLMGCGSEDDDTLPGPIAYYSFDAYAERAEDESGNGHVATPGGKVEFLPQGGVGGTGAIQLDANYEGLNLEDRNGDLVEATLYGDNGYTMAAWVYPIDTTDDGSYHILYRFQGYTLQLEKGEFHFWTRSPDLHSDFEYWNKTAVSVSGLRPAGANNTWWHLVGVADGNSVYLYVNGVLQDQNDEATVGRNLDEEQTTSIGDTGTAFGFRGIIDEVVIYNTPLSAGQVKLLYEQNI
ncbi:MAG: LamG domain-containing protein [Deltaproteobacteria bacterium]|nr:LamG domain-containing protein [Deltaproteobacteria bacterium]